MCVCGGGGGGGGERGYTGIAVSSCPSLHVSVCRLCPEDILWTVQPFVSKPEMVVQRPEPVCRAQELGCYLQGQGHNKGLYNYNMTVSNYINAMISSGLIFFFFFFFLELSLLVDNHKPKYTLKMCYCCVKGQGHSNGSKFNLILVWTVPSEPLKL